MIRISMMPDLSFMRGNIGSLPLVINKQFYIVFRKKYLEQSWCKLGVFSFFQFEFNSYDIMRQNVCLLNFFLLQLSIYSEFQFFVFKFTTHSLHRMHKDGSTGAASLSQRLSKVEIAIAHLLLEQFYLFFPRLSLR